MTVKNLPSQQDVETAVTAILKRLDEHLSMVRDMVPLKTPEQIREILPLVGATLKALQSLEAWLFDWRLACWRAGRKVTPPITNKELGTLASVSEVAVMKVLHKDRDANAT